MSLDSLIDKSVVVSINQEDIPIMPLIVREIPAFAEQIGPIIGLLKAENIDYINLITNHYPNVVIAVSIAARHDREWVESLGVDDLVKLIMAIMEVNFDFLVNHVHAGLAGSGQETGWPEIDVAFRKAGLGTVLDMSLKQVKAYYAAIQKMEVERLKLQAIAVRAGMADEKRFKRWIKSLS